MDMISALTLVAEGRAELARVVGSLWAYGRVANCWRTFPRINEGGDSYLPPPRDIRAPWETLTFAQLRSEAKD